MTNPRYETAGSLAEIPRLSSLRYSRAYTLTIEALHTMCCESGNTRERLKKIDPEFFSLRSEDVPERDGVRELVVELHRLVTHYPPRWEGDGVVAATLSQSHHTILKQMAQLIWDVHQKLSQYMQSGHALN